MSRAGVGRKILTTAGSTTGIDTALILAAEMAGEDVARAMQLGLEYDPDSPFDSGSFLKASPQLIKTFSRLDNPPETSDSNA